MEAPQCFFPAQSGSIARNNGKRLLRPQRLPRVQARLPSSPASGFASYVFSEPGIFLAAPDYQPCLSGGCLRQSVPRVLLHTCQDHVTTVATARILRDLPPHV